AFCWMFEPILPSSARAFASSTVSTEGRRRGGRGTSSSTARHMAEGDRPVASTFSMIAAFWAGVQLMAMRAVTLRFWLPLVLISGSFGRIQPAYGWSGVQGRNAACAGPRGKAPGRWGAGGERSLPRSGVQRRNALVWSTDQRSWAGGCNGGRSCPLAKMRRSRWRVEHAHILRAVTRRLILCCSRLVFQYEGRRTNREWIDVTA